MKKIVGVVGSGMVGRDPFDPDCWSGSGYRLFQSMQQENVLTGAFGVDISKTYWYILAALNFHRNKKIWKRKLSLDTKFYKALTSKIKAKIGAYGNDNIFLQLGAIYDVPELLQGRAPCVSYHDGNIAQLMKSPAFPKELIPYARKAFDWEKSVYEKLDKIFTMSEYLRRSFIHDFDMPEGKVINAGAGPNFDIPKVLSPKDPTSKDILYVGTDFDRKGGDTLVKAFVNVYPNHPTAKLHIVGPVTAPNVLSEVNCPGIVFHGLLSRVHDLDKITALRERSTLYVLPSRYEPFGISVLEAMCYGMAAIATNRWAFPEMISPGQTGELIEPDDIDDLTSKMDYYLSNDDLRIQHGINARKDIMGRYSWRNVTNSISATN